MQRPSPSYSLTLRIEYPNQVGMLGRVTSVIGEEGGDIGAIDIVSAGSSASPGARHITRDITFAARDYEHGQGIVQAVRRVEGIDVVNVSDRTFLLHLGGKLEVRSKVPVKTRDDLSMIYTPGVERIAQTIAEDPSAAYDLTIKKNTVAVVTDGGEVLGLGAAGPFAALPVMEAKAMLFREFAGVDAFPLCLDAQSDDDFVTAIKAVAPSFGAIHLEDLGSPRCFYLEERLQKELSIPVMHNDQHGTAICVLAALMNSLRIVGKASGAIRVVINSAGAAGVATAKLLTAYGVRDIVMCSQSQGEVLTGDQPDYDPFVANVLRGLNPRKVTGSLRDALRGADAFIGFGGRHALEREDIEHMNPQPIVFAMANPYPEVEPSQIADIARVVATGKSDFPNQINNMLCFPGFFRGLLDARAKSINDRMKLDAAAAIADLVGRDELHEDYLIPSVFDRRVSGAVARAVREAATATGVAGRPATRSGVR